MSSGLYSDSSLLSEIVFPKLEAIVDAERPICQKHARISALQNKNSGH
jgi:hypothetical protein